MNIRKRTPSFARSISLIASFRSTWPTVLVNHTRTGLLPTVASFGLEFSFARLFGEAFLLSARRPIWVAKCLATLGLSIRIELFACEQRPLGVQLRLPVHVQRGVLPS